MVWSNAYLMNLITGTERSAIFSFNTGLPARKKQNWKSNAQAHGVAAQAKRLRHQRQRPSVQPGRREDRDRQWDPERAGRKEKGGRERARIRD